MGIALPQVVTSDRASGAQVIDGSLKFDSGSSNYLKRTLSSASNRGTWTWSGWIKRAQQDRQTYFSSGNAAANSFGIEIQGDSKLWAYDYSGSFDWQLLSNELFRDIGWYHLVFVYDTTQATSSDRIKFYINGRQVTNFGTATYPSQNFQGYTNSNIRHTVGSYTTPDIYTDGSMSQVYLIDGQALGPESFGYTDGLTNTWRPKKYTGSTNDTTYPNNINTNFSDNLTASSGFQSAYPAVNAFDGEYGTNNTTGRAAANNSGSSLTFSPSGGIVVNNKIEVFTRDGTITVNGGSAYTSNTDFTFKDISSVSPSTPFTLTSLVVTGASGNNAGEIYAIRIDGIVLKNNAGWGKNGFYLPMDGNSPIGHDKSNPNPVNNGTVWSSGAGANFESANPASNGFNGSADSYTRTDNANVTATVTLPSAVPFTTLQVRGARDSGNGTITVNGVNVSSQYASGSATLQTITLTGVSSPLTSIALTGISGAAQPRFSQIIVDGIVLVDNMYGNGWTPVNFGGSVALDNPQVSGARPILNTLPGGTIATPGVLGSRENKTFAVTVASVGGSNKYHFDGVDRPNPTLIRGVTYTFNQSDASNGGGGTHPLRFATAADAAGSTQYTDGVTVSKGVPGTSSTDYGGLFDGVNDYLAIPSSSDYAFGTGDFSVEAWLKTNPTGTYMNCINTRGAGGTTAGWTFSVESDNTIGFYSNGHQFGAAGTVTPGEWTHICVTRVSSVLRAFVNGVLIGYNGSHSQNYTNTSLSIGIHNDANGNGWYKGEMSDVRMLKGGIPSEFSTSATSLGTSVFTVNSKRTSVTNTKLLILQASSVTTATTIATGSITNNGVSLVQFDDLYSPITRITVPHNAPDTLYYYCTNHGGMGSSTSQTTDETKADPYAWKNVFALPLVGNSNDISNQINSGSTTKTITVVGNPVASSDTSNFYGGSFEFDGTDDALHPNAVTNDFAFGTGDFTFEFWFRTDSSISSTRKYLVDFRNNGSGSCSGDHPFIIWADNGSDSNGTWIRYGNDTNSPSFDLLGGRGLPPTNTWHHLAVVRSGNTVSGYLNGVFGASATDNTNYGSSSFSVGAACNNGVNFVGCMSDVRVYKGAAKYTSNFVVASTSPDILPDTPSGVSGGSKLAKVTDGAVQLKRSGGYLDMGTSHTDLVPGSGDFTIECSLYVDAFANYPVIVDSRVSGASDTGGFFWGLDTNGLLYLYTHSGIRISTTIESRSWYHLALVRTSNVFKMFVNGVHIGDYTQSQNYTNQIRYIGYSTNSESQTWYMDGKISNFRFVKGTAVYTNNFTPPSAPLTNVTNTKLLCCQSNTSATEGAVKPGSITANGNAAATTFNPFNTDINTVRGQESGYATWNPLNKNGGSLSNGNLSLTSGGATNLSATLQIPTTGKWYWEYFLDGQTSGGVIGIADGSAMNGTALGDWTKIYGYSPNGNKYENASASSYGPTLATGDLVGVKYYADTRQLEFLKNNMSQGVAYTVSGEYDYYPSIHGNSIDVTANFGQKPFKFPPPAGFQPLNAANVRPETVIARPDHYVGVTTYLGTGAAQKIPGLNFQSDLIWVKARDANYNHRLWDSVKGFGSGKALYADETSAMGTNSSNDGVISTDIDGWTFTTTGARVNNAKNYVGWAWKAGGSKNTFNKDDVGYASAAAAGLTGGTITPTGSSVGTKQGFSIIKYTGNGNAATIPHGLSQTPTFIIKKFVTASSNWDIWTPNIGADKRLVFSDAATSSTTSYQSVNASTFDVHAGNNDDTVTMIAYLWHDVPGLQKFGKYTGNNSTNGPFIELGFRPAIVWVKRFDSSGTGDWRIWDTTRDPFNFADNKLYPNKSDEETGSSDTNEIDILSNGFKLRSNVSEGNASGGSYIYCAWAEAPTFNLFGGQSNAF